MTRYTHQVTVEAPDLEAIDGLLQPFERDIREILNSLRRYELSDAEMTPDHPSFLKSELCEAVRTLRRATQHARNQLRLLRENRERLNTQ
jgi:hypothetical protein